MKCRKIGRCTYAAAAAGARGGTRAGPWACAPCAPRCGSATPRRPPPGCRCSPAGKHVISSCGDNDSEQNEIVYRVVWVGAAAAALQRARLPVAPVDAARPHAQREHVVQPQPRHALCGPTVRSMPAHTAPPRSPRPGECTPLENSMRMWLPSRSATAMKSSRASAK